MPPQFTSTPTLIHTARSVDLFSSDNTPTTSSSRSPRTVTRHKSRADSYGRVTWITRLLLLVVAGLMVVFRAPLQSWMDETWEVLKNSPVFYSAYFETVYVTIVYALIMIFYPFAMHFIPYFQKFKVSDDVTYVHRRIIGMDGLIVETLSYLGTYALADAFKMKKYSYVDDAEWEKRRGQWIQTTRALPKQSPDVLLLCVKVVAALVLFDALFFAIHYALHKNAFLYKYVHSQHHDHDVMHPHVTNQLSMVERILQVSSANYSLLFLRCHPVTRVVFVPFYVWFLIENHTGYDLPWAPHRLMPRGWMGGPAKHHDHHQHGSRSYQPFFNYLDAWLERRAERRKACKLRDE